MADGSAWHAALRPLLPLLLVPSKAAAAVFNLAVHEFEERAVVSQECRVFLAKKICLDLGTVLFLVKGWPKRAGHQISWGTIRLSREIGRNNRKGGM